MPDNVDAPIDEIKLPEILSAEKRWKTRTVEVHRAKLLAKFNARKLHDLVAKLSGMPL